MSASLPPRGRGTASNPHNRYAPTRSEQQDDGWYQEETPPSRATEVRKEKAMRYWFHRCLAPCFVAWVNYTEGSLRVKGMFLKQLMGVKRRLFERWYAYVEWNKKRRFAHFLARNLADRACEETLFRSRCSPVLNPVPSWAKDTSPAQNKKK